MKRLLLILFIMSSLMLSACSSTIIRGSGNVASEDRVVDDFDAVDMAEAAQVIITQGEPQSVRVEADDNLIQYIRTEVRGHTLHIYKDPMDVLSINTRRSPRIYITVKNVSALKLSGSGSISSEKIQSDDLNLDLSGSGDINLNGLNAASLDVDISGSGSCELEGKVNHQSIHLSGSGRYLASQLDSRNTQIDISGSGKADVLTKETLDMHVSGSGDILYSGNPDKVTQDITGSGKVRSK
ncbi:MAG: DUF2807 domain-containing protein [Anaerolineae bacterium]|nr:DUF2807 domain-containing protein [Anaerolineae bacterium]